MLPNQFIYEAKLLKISGKILECLKILKMLKLLYLN